MALTRMRGANSRARSGSSTAPHPWRRSRRSSSRGRDRPAPSHVDDLPSPWRDMARIASRPTRNTPRRLTAISRSNSGCGVQERLVEQDAGIVDQDVEATQAWQGGIEHSQDLGLVGNTSTPTGNARPPLAAADLLHPLRPGPVGDRAWQPSAASARTSARRCRGAAGDDGPPAGQRPGHAITSPRSTLTACPVMLRARSEARNR